MNYFKDEVVIVTGGAAGIGRVLCEELSKGGAIVVVADINANGAEKVASTITAANGRAVAEHLDVSQADEVQNLINKTASEYGKLDYIFNNAGILIVKKMNEMTLEEWHKLINVNLLGVIYGTTSAYQIMSKQGFGHIVNIASLAGLVPSPLFTAYSTTKHAIVGLSTSLKIEAKPCGVKVSVVCPGFVQTDILNDQTIPKLPFKNMEVTQAGLHILRGVQRNQNIIVFPFHARFLWWLYRYFPASYSLAK
jgi:NAD(P)-dependent dehydrogenase (short-subunit alcohol dehydrogenase family)